ncbi:MAG: glycoside hydrolase family 97 catalytic domain-containing protein, partial [Candidatus Hodarchaeota archaeon]
SNMHVKNITTSEINEDWKPIYGEREVIPNRYNQVVVCYEQKERSKVGFKVEFRLFDEGIAFQYHLAEYTGVASKIITITDEFTQFHFNKNCFAWKEHGTEGKYERVPITKMMPLTQRPLTIEDPSGTFMALTEAGSGSLEGAIDGAAPNMLISPYDEYSPILVPDFGGVAGFMFKRPGTVRTTTPYSSSWRLLLVGESPGALMEQNYLVLNLNPPCAMDGDTTWIRPGKVIREVTLTTSGGKVCVDFCVEHGLQYIEFDAGWYGKEGDETSDGTTVQTKRPDKLKDFGDPEDWEGLNLPEVVRYASSKGIGVWLYVNRRVIERQLGEILPLYKKWGIAGLKFGFVTVGTQEENAIVLDAVRRCADFQLMVDIHDEYRPTGFSRTYPNLLTQEGVRGNEHMPTTSHYCTLPFTRFPAGAADVTICYYNERIKPTRAQQLAHAVIFYSPLQFVFWYDKPEHYNGEPEIEFFEKVPTTWDETRVLHGFIGEYASVARRKGGEWFVGTITNENAREISICLDFLEPGVEYTGCIYTDHEAIPDASYTPRTGVAINQQVFKKDQTLIVKLVENGGHAMILTMKRL